MFNLYFTSCDIGKEEKKNNSTFNATQSEIFNRIGTKAKGELSVTRFKGRKAFHGNVNTLDRADRQF